MLLYLATDRINPVTWDSQHQLEGIVPLIFVCYVYILQTWNSLQAEIAKTFVWHNMLSIDAFKNTVH